MKLENRVSSLLSIIAWPSTAALGQEALRAETDKKLTGLAVPRAIALTNEIGFKNEMLQGVTRVIS